MGVPFVPRACRRLVGAMHAINGASVSLGTPSVRKSSPASCRQLAWTYTTLPTPASVSCDLSWFRLIGTWHLCLDMRTHIWPPALFLLLFCLPLVFCLPRSCHWTWRDT